MVKQAMIWKTMLSAPFYKHRTRKREDGNLNFVLVQMKEA